MAEQQLVDYIKKAKDAGQADSQSRDLLYKSGWTEAEVNDAFAVLIQPQAQPAPQPEPEPVSQPESQMQPVAVQEPEIQPQQQPEPQMAQQNVIHTRRGSHLVLKLIMVLIILVVVGGAGYFVAGQYINIPWNPFLPSTQTVFGNMLANMKSVKYFHTTAGLEVDATDSNKVSQGKLVLTLAGDSDATDANNLKTSAAVNAGLTLPASALPVASVNVKIVSIGGVLYAQANSLTVPPSYSYLGLDASQITGKWLEIYQGFATGNLTPTGNIFSNVKQLSDQVVSGQDAYHYSATVSNANLQALINKITVQPAVKDYVNTLGDVNMEIWIGKKDYMLYGIKIDKAVSLGNVLQGIGIGAPGANLQAEVILNITNSDFNKPVSVQAPVGAQKIEDVMHAQKIKADLNQINSLAQSYFLVNKSYYSICSKTLINGSLKTYGSQLAFAGNDISNQGVKKLICLSGISSYCLSAQLADDSWVCIGKTGTIGSLQCNSFKMVCE